MSDGEKKRSGEYHAKLGSWRVISSSLSSSRIDAVRLPSLHAIVRWLQELIDDAYIGLKTKMVDAYGIEQHKQKV